MYLGFETRFYDGSREVSPTRVLHTLVLEPDHSAGPRVSLVWHSALPCHFKVQKLQHTVVTLKTDRSRRRATADVSPPDYALS